MHQFLLNRLFCTAAITFGVASSNCAIAAGPPEFVDMDFLALLNGRQASIIEVDSQGKATAQPIDFLENETIQSWDVASLGEIITCEKNLLQNADYDLKYFQNRAMVRTFHLHNAIPQIWLLLVPARKSLLVGLSKNGHPATVKFDLSTGSETEVVIASAGSVSGYPVMRSRPIWDAAQNDFVAWIEDRSANSSDQHSHEYLAWIDPDHFAVMGKVQLEEHAGMPIPQIRQLLAYRRLDNAVICYGVIGEPPLYGYHGSSGVFSISLDTGKAKMLMKDTTPNFSGRENSPFAIVNGQYIVMTRFEGASVEGEGERTFLLDLKSATWKDLFPLAKQSEVPYVTWPISQDGLHVQGASMPVSTTAQGQPKATGTQ